MMRKEIAVGVLAATVFCACAKKEETARLLLDQARTEYQADNAKRAKVLLDSVIFSFSEEKEVVAEAQSFLQDIYMTEQEQNKLVLDSLLTIREGEIKNLLKQFDIEDEQSDNPVLLHRRQRAAVAYERSYVRGYTDLRGNFYMSSHYTGSKHLNHCAVRVSVDESYAQTDSVTLDAYNHSFDDGEQVWEVVKYKGGRDNGAAAFVARNYDKRIVVTFVSAKQSKYRITLSQIDKEALRDTYQLSVLLREKEHIKSQLADVTAALEEMRGRKNNKTYTNNK